MIDKLEYLHSTAPVPPIADAMPPKLRKLTPEIEAVIKRCLKKEPADRYAKVAELRKALLGILTRAGGRI